MNRLEGAVRAIMRTHNIESVAQVAAAVGISKSELHKMFSGDRGVSPAKLRKLVGAISGSAEERFQVLRAHLLDEVERSGFDLASVEIRLGGDQGAVSFGDLPLVVQLDLRAIGEEIRDGDNGLGFTVRWLASMVRAKADGTLYPLGDAGQSQQQVAEDGPIPTNFDEANALAKLSFAAENESGRGQKVGDLESRELSDRNDGSGGR